MLMFSLKELLKQHLAIITRKDKIWCLYLLRYKTKKHEIIPNVFVKQPYLYFEIIFAPTFKQLFDNFNSSINIDFDSKFKILINDEHTNIWADYTDIKEIVLKNNTPIKIISESYEFLNFEEKLTVFFTSQEQAIKFKLMMV
jgi:hypothetical protein